MARAVSFFQVVDLVIGNDVDNDRDTGDDDDDCGDKFEGRGASRTRQEEGRQLILRLGRLKEHQGTPWKIIAGNNSLGTPWELKEFMKLAGTSMKAE